MRGRKRRGRGRARRRNLPLTVRVGGKRMTWKRLVSKLGVKRAAAKWRRKGKLHGWTKTRVRAANRKRRSSRRGRRRNSPITLKVGRRRVKWKTLVKRYGIKKASKLWRRGSRKGRLRHGWGNKYSVRLKRRKRRGRKKNPFGRRRR